MVTSSAVVGSSAMISLGSLASAIAIITRCLIPPDNSCGYAPYTRSGIAIPTRFNISIDFAFASRVSVVKEVEEEEKIPATEKKTSVKYSDFKKGVRVSHPHFGEGEVLVEVTDFVGAFVTIKFEKVGIKTLSLKFAPITIIE